MKYRGVVVIFLLLISGIGAFLYSENTFSHSVSLKTFSSYQELKSFVSNGMRQAAVDVFVEPTGKETPPYAERGDVVTDLGIEKEGTDFSRTNVQVEGVDEADIVKTDGSYIYKVVNHEGNNSVVIIGVESGKMDIVSWINLSYHIAGIFINDNRLGIICNNIFPLIKEKKVYIPGTALYIYNISNPRKPEEIYNYTVSGSYLNSRMLGKWIYIVSNQNIYWMDENKTVPLPVAERNGEVHQIPATDIQYIDVPQHSYVYTIISAINITSGKSSERAFILGESSMLYVSRSNIYIVTSNTWADENNSRQETTIFKFGMKEGNITYKAMGKVKGHILNQFSMDEYRGYFRIATTQAEWWNEDASVNNVYVLDDNMNIIGKLEGIAKGERIYSARFMGDKLYLVTFRQIDPLFTVDLGDPMNPKEIGHLKITGASQYLHPYDDEHIIGVGFEATEDGMQTGLKVSLFNVSNFGHPEEISKYVIKGAFSEFARDHHAFLFNRSKNLLVIPVEIWGDEGERVYAYVFNITLEKGIVYVATIQHEPKSHKNKTLYYFYNGSGGVYREYASASPGDYIDIFLTTTSDREWVLDEFYDKNIIKLENFSISMNGNNKTYHYLFRCVEVGHSYIEMDLMGVSGGRIKKYGEFNLDVSSYKPYWIYYNYRITRSLYIGNFLYTISNLMVKSNHIGDMKEIDAIDLGNYV